jgi:hypothetical protein
MRRTRVQGNVDRRRFCQGGDFLHALNLSHAPGSRCRLLAFF